MPVIRINIPEDSHRKGRMKALGLRMTYANYIAKLIDDDTTDLPDFEETEIESINGD